MRLLIDGVALCIARMGPASLLVDADRLHAPGLATIVLRVDASERQWSVFLPQGITAAGMQEVAVAPPAGQTMSQAAE